MKSLATKLVKSSGGSPQLKKLEMIFFLSLVGSTPTNFSNSTVLTDYALLRENQFIKLSMDRSYILRDELLKVQLRILSTSASRSALERSFIATVRRKRPSAKSEIISHSADSAEEYTKFQCEIFRIIQGVGASFLRAVR